MGVINQQRWLAGTALQSMFPPQIQRKLKLSVSHSRILFSVFPINGCSPEYGALCFAHLQLSAHRSNGNSQPSRTTKKTDCWSQTPLKHPYVVWARFGLCKLIWRVDSVVDSTHLKEYKDKSVKLTSWSRSNLLFAPIFIASTPTLASEMGINL